MDDYDFLVSREARRIYEKKVALENRGWGVTLETSLDDLLMPDGLLYYNDFAGRTIYTTDIAWKDNENKIIHTISGVPYHKRQDAYLQILISVLNSINNTLISMNKILNELVNNKNG